MLVFTLITVMWDFFMSSKKFPLREGNKTPTEVNFKFLERRLC